MSGGWQEFWDWHEWKVDFPILPRDFKDLIEAMLSANPGARPNLLTLDSYPYLIGLKASKDQVIQELETRDLAYKERRC